jgi:folate-dependent phosphoribosylglycinamide formyltransferase PurN
MTGLTLKHKILQENKDKPLQKLNKRRYDVITCKGWQRILEMTTLGHFIDANLVGSA